MIKSPVDIIQRTFGPQRDEVSTHGRSSALIAPRSFLAEFNRSWHFVPSGSIGGKECL
jgi:hypothetical protein